MSVIKGDGGSPIDPQLAEIDRLRADNAAKDARIAELEAGWANLANKDIAAARARAEKAEARIAELEAMISRIKADLPNYANVHVGQGLREELSDVTARAEKAEADCKRAEAVRDALREALEFIADRITGEHTAWVCAKARAALQSCASAKQDALREALVKIERRTRNAINVQVPNSMDDFIKSLGADARAALQSCASAKQDALREALAAARKQLVILGGDSSYLPLESAKALGLDLIQRAVICTIDAALQSCASAKQDVLLDGSRPLPFDRDHLGRLVREAWVRWAYTQPNPKPSWLVDYDELSEPDKEADRQIGECIARWTIIGDAARASAKQDDPSQAELKE